MTDIELLKNYIKSNDAYHDKQDQERREMLELISDMAKKVDDTHRAIFGNPETCEKGLVERTEVLDMFQGFWKIVGILIGAITVFSAFIAAIIYIKDTVIHMLRP